MAETPDPTKAGEGLSVPPPPRPGPRQHFLTTAGSYLLRSTNQGRGLREVRWLGQGRTAREGRAGIQAPAGLCQRPTCASRVVSA